MRDIPEALTLRMAQGTAKLCHAWILTRADGRRLGFTDHDRPLEVDGVTCRPGSGLTAGAAGAELGQAADASALGVLDSEGLDEAGLNAGAFDGAEVALWRVDWEQPELRVRLWTQVVRRIVREGQAFTAELEGPLARLNRPVGRTYARSCDARLGDGRCGVDLSDPAYAGLSCDQRFETCRDLFGNTDNFRGFPCIPGEDFLTLYPAAGERHDGGRR